MLEITKLVKQIERKKMREREREKERDGKGAKIWHFWEFVCSLWTFTNFDFFGRQRRKSLNADVLVKLSVISISPPRLRIRNLLREFLFLGTLQLKIKKKQYRWFQSHFQCRTLSTRIERGERGSLTSRILKWKFVLIHGWKSMRKSLRRKQEKQKKSSRATEREREGQKKERHIIICFILMCFSSCFFFSTAAVVFLFYFSTFALFLFCAFGITQHFQLSQSSMMKVFFYC